MTVHPRLAILIISIFQVQQNNKSTLINKLSDADNKTVANSKKHKKKYRRRSLEVNSKPKKRYD